MTLKQTTALLAALTLSMTLLSGCGKEKTASSTGSNIVPKASSSAQPGQSEPGGAGQSQTPEKNYEVQLDERTDETKYQYGMDDLSLVDTVSGQKLTIGMTADEVEKITGAPVSTDRSYRTYDGVVVLYTEDGKAGSLIVASGQFPDEAQATRYKSSRGVGLNTAFDDFVKAYGDQYNQRREDAAEGENEVPAETPASAIRYFRMDGKKVEYLGTTLTDDMEKDGTENLYMQDFMFDRDSNQVITMRISGVDSVGK